MRLAERFLRYLSPAEQDTLEVLAIPRSFDQQLAADLIAAFHTELPLGQVPELTRFSFVSERTPGVYQLHDVLQECLERRLERRNPHRRRELYAYLFRRYDALLEGLQPREIGLVQEQAFREALFHARHREPDELVGWFLVRAACFLDGARFPFLLPLHEELLAFLNEQTEPHPLSEGRVQAHLALLLARLGQYARADELFRLSLAVLESMLGSSHLEVREARWWQGGCLLEAGRYSESEEVLRACCTPTDAAAAADDPVRAGGLLTLGLAVYEQGRWPEAQDACTEALRIAEALDLPLRPRIMLNLASILLDQGYFARADALLSDALALLDGTCGRLNLDGATGLNLLGWSCLYQDRYQEAERAIQEALAIVEKTDNRGTSLDAGILSSLAQLSCEQGRLTEALELMAQVEACPSLPTLSGTMAGSKRSSWYAWADTQKRRHCSNIRFRCSDRRALSSHGRGPPLRPTACTANCASPSPAMKPPPCATGGALTCWNSTIAPTTQSWKASTPPWPRFESERGKTTKRRLAACGRR
jgi:tetratricopeptide (TPR) repeat protein